MSLPSDRDRLLEVLVRADSRRRRNHALNAALAGLALAFIPVVVVAGWQLVVPVPAAAWGLAGAAGLALIVVPALWVWWRPARPDVAAAMLDRTGSLNDELTTAEWFVRSGATASPWLAEQVGRAAATANRLDLGSLCVRPRQRWATLLAAGAAAVTTGLLLIPASTTRGILASSADRLLTADQKDRLDELRTLVQDETFAQQAPQARARAAEILEEIEEGLQAGDAMRTASALDDLASTLAGAAEGEGAPAGEAAQSRTNQREAPGAGSETTTTADNESAAGRSGSESLDDRLRRELARAVDRARALAQTMRALETDPAQLARAERTDAGAQRGEPMAGAATMPAGGLGEALEPVDSQGGADSLHRGGDLSGAPTGRTERDQGQTDDLAVTLKREQLDSSPDALMPSSSELVERPSQSATAQLEYQSISALRAYAPSGSYSSDAVPWAYRQLVKGYFLARTTPSQDPR